MEGVVRVLVGYSGGKKKDPSYYNLGDHTEALFIEYDPKRVSYSEILKMWRENDYPWKRQRRQYRSAIFFTTLRQQDEAILFLEDMQNKYPGRKLHVDLELAHKFYRAESYHQNYLAKLNRAYSAKPCLSGVCEVPWKRNQKTNDTGLHTITIPE